MQVLAEQAVAEEQEGTEMGAIGDGPAAAEPA